MDPGQIFLSDSSQLCIGILDSQATLSQYASHGFLNTSCERTSIYKFIFSKGLLKIGLSTLLLFHPLLKMLRTAMLDEYHYGRVYGLILSVVGPGWRLSNSHVTSKQLRFRFSQQNKNISLYSFERVDNNYERWSKDNIFIFPGRWRLVVVEGNDK